MAPPPLISLVHGHCAAPVEIFPFLFAACLIVSGPLHPISFFPFLFISVTIAILAMPLYIASHAALSRTWIKAREAVVAALTGAAVAMFYDILFILPPVCLVVLLLRGWIMGITIRRILRTNAFLRYLAFSCGFLTVFVPARIAMALRCNAGGCYEYANTELALSGSVIPLWIGRAFSGLPWDGMGLMLRGDIDAGLSPRGPLGLLSNTWTITVIALMLLLAMRAGRHLVYKRAQSYSSNTLRKGSANTSKEPSERRIGAVLIIIGITLICSSSLLVSVTQGLQGWHERGLGLRPWRDTLLVQIGWAFTLFGALHLLLTLRKFKVLRLSAGLIKALRYFTNQRFKILAIAGSAAVLFALTVLTFVANDRYALTRRYDPYSNIDNLIAVAAVDFDDTERGQRIRCQLIDAYIERVSGSWPTGRRLLRDLNRLAKSEYGSDFCPAPT